MPPSKSLILNIGSGPHPPKGQVNLDIHPFPGVDIVHDIQQPWPFPDLTFSRINAHHVLEHLSALIPAMNQAYRCLKFGGTISIKVPWWSGEWAHGDPSHIRFFDHNSFSPFSDWWQDYRHLAIAGPWLKLSQTYTHRPQDHNTQFLQQMGFSTCTEMITILQRPPGG